MTSRAAPIDLETARATEASHFLPVVNRMPVVLVEGRGSRVRDERGRELVDLTAGWGVTSIGHCHPALVAAVCDQAGRLMQTTNLFYTVPQIRLLETFARVLPRELPRAFVVSSGTEAIDGAIKLAHRATGRARFVSTAHSFHGRTIGALRISGQPKHRDPYKGLLPPAHVVPFGDLDAARAAIDDETAAFVVEPIQGEGGVNVPPEGYLRGVREICDRRGALLVLDEIQTGIGRSGRMLALEHEGVMPDVITLGKCLGGGFPVAAFVCTEAVAKTVQLGDHGGTYVGNPIACAAADATIRVIEEDKLCARSADLGARLLARLRGFAAERPDLCVEARGRGLLVGLELRDEKHAGSIPLRALERGVLVNVTQGRVVRFFPALNIPEDELFSALGVVLGLVTEGS